MSLTATRYSNRAFANLDRTVHIRWVVNPGPGLSWMGSTHSKAQMTMSHRLLASRGGTGFGAKRGFFGFGRAASESGRAARDREFVDSSSGALRFSASAPLAPRLPPRPRPCPRPQTLPSSNCRLGASVGATSAWGIAVPAMCVSTSGSWELRVTESVSRRRALASSG